MTEMDVREFLNGFQAEELAGKGILNGGTRLLNNGSVEPLIALISEHGVSRLEAPERGWSLASTRTMRAGNDLKTTAPVSRRSAWSATSRRRCAPTSASSRLA